MKVLKNGVFCCICICLISTALLAKDIIKKEIKVGDEIEISGLVGTYDKNLYFVKITDKKIAKLLNMIGDKKIDLEQYNGKEVVVKGIYGGTLSESKGQDCMVFTSLSAITLKEKSKESEEKKNKETPKDPGNIPPN